MQEQQLVTEGRKLVTIRAISEIDAIPGADNIVVATVDGWQVVIKKGEFSVGDKCVFFEIDSFLPVEPRYEFLVRNGTKVDEEGVERIRLRSVKLRKQISQGLALPIHMFPELNVFDLENLMLEGYGIENYLNVTKYERPSERNGGQGNFTDAGGDFPWFISKSDEERVQNIYNKYVQKYHNVLFRKSLKLDGSSCTVAYITNQSYFFSKLDRMKAVFNEDLQELVHELEEVYPYKDEEHQVIVCSRNRTLKYSADSNFWKAVEGQNLIEKIKTFSKETGRQIAFQGEVLAPSIQGNPEKVTEPTFFVYRIIDIDTGKSFGDTEFQETCQNLEIRQCPQMEVEKPFSDYSTLKELLDVADIPSLNSKIAEGIVYKSVEPVDGNIIHFKVINNKWLLKCED